MPLNLDGTLQAIMLGTESYIPLDAYVREIYINEAPLLTTTKRRMKAMAEAYNIITYDVRPNTYTLNASITTSTTTMTLVDATPLLPGDVLEVTRTDGAAIERVEVQGQYNTSDGLVYATLDGLTVNVRRSRESTAAVANDAAAYPILNLIGNSRTGAEMNQGASRSTRGAIQQQVQTYQFPVSIGGKAQLIETVALPAGIPDILTLEQKTQLTQLVRDAEKGLYYGIGERPVAVGDRAKQMGLRAMIKTYKSGLNYTPAAGGSYTKQNLVRDGVQKAIDGGGRPNVCLCSTDFATFISTWTSGSQYFTTPQYTELGVMIESFVAPFLGRPILFVPSYQLRTGTGVFLTGDDYMIRYLREPGFNRRGILGDAVQGDFIADICGEIGHPGWHSWVEGITSAA